MSAAKHTPGPWYADKIEDRAAYNIFTPGSCSALLTIEPGKFDGADPRASSVEADARLIAAAPALLEALHHAEAWIRTAPHGDNCFVSDHYEGDPGDRCNCGKDDALEAVQAAIAAATGGAL